MEAWNDGEKIFVNLSNDDRSDELSDLTNNDESNGLSDLMDDDESEGYRITDDQQPEITAYLLRENVRWEQLGCWQLIYSYLTVPQHHHYFQSCLTSELTFILFSQIAQTSFP